MDSTRQQTVHGPRRWLSIVLGLFFVGLAAAGVLLPVLPTTPFLILASACFVRSSPRLNAWLLRSRLFGPMLRQWQEHRRVQRRVKYAAAGVLLLAVSLSAWIGQLSWPWMTLLVALALIGLVVVLRLPEMPDPALATVPVGDAASVAAEGEMGIGIANDKGGTNLSVNARAMKDCDPATPAIKTPSQPISSARPGPFKRHR